MSRIRLDYTNCLADRVGSTHGIEPAELEALRAPSAAAIEAVQARRTQDLRWLDLPYQDEVVADVLGYAESVRGRFQNVVVLGIGGSALGNRALHHALNGPFHDLDPPAGQPRLYVLDNVDPEFMAEFLEHIDLRSTLFNVISKSGGTAETMSQFLLLRERLIAALGEDAHKEHMVLTTDAEKGVLREIVSREGYRSFIVPDGVGGRFSVLSPVGLLSAALVGIDVPELIAGAAEMDQRCRSTVLEENPALLHAGLQHLLHNTKGLPIAVSFVYSQRLAYVGDWYAQLLGESIGKRLSNSGEEVFVGPTPVRAIGVTDQHSQVQLYVEGPYDKWFTLMGVEQPAKDVELPLMFEDLEGVAYLGGRKLSELFHAEREGTRIALTEARRPNCSITLETIDARALGELIVMLEVSVAVMGEHYQINAFDQPGVEAGKVAAYALMGRAGYEERKAEIEAAAPSEVRAL